MCNLPNLAVECQQTSCELDYKPTVTLTESYTVSRGPNSPTWLNSSANMRRRKQHGSEVSAQPALLSTSFMRDIDSDATCLTAAFESARHALNARIASSSPSPATWERASAADHLIPECDSGKHFPPC